MVNINIRCPKCSRNRMISLSEEEIQFKPSGLFSINIDKDFTCEHTYVAYIDRHYKIRDYFDLDYNIELPEIISVEEIEVVVDDLTSSYDFDLVKINLTANILTIIFKAIIAKKPILFIKDKDIYYDSLIPFFRKINEDLFEFDMELLNEENYKNSKAKFKKHVVLDNSITIKNPYKFIDIKKLKVEKRIINSFMGESETSIGLKKIRNHIKNAYDLAVIICNYIKNQEKDKNIYTKHIIDYLGNTREITISSQYLDFLIEIVNQYFGIPVKLSIPHYTGVF